VTEVDAAVHDSFERFRVVGFYADPSKWRATSAPGKAGTAADSRSRPHVIIRLSGGWAAARATVRALDRFHNAVTDREISHDASYVLTRHALNARRRISKAGVQIAKEHPDSPKKIDALVSSVLAFEARADAIAAGITDTGDMGGWTF
jgi:hypothetical protein